MGMLASLTFCLLLLEEEEEPFAEEEDIVRRFSVFSSCRYLSFEGVSFSELFLFDGVVFFFPCLTYLQTSSVGENRRPGSF